MIDRIFPAGLALLMIGWLISFLSFAFSCYFNSTDATDKLRLPFDDPYSQVGLQIGAAIFIFAITLIAICGIVYFIRAATGRKK